MPIRLRQGNGKKTVLEDAELYTQDHVRLERSPHPYLRRKEDLATEGKDSEDVRGQQLLPPLGAFPSARGVQDPPRSSRSLVEGLTASDSGTDAEDDTFRSVKALLPPVARPRKGLKDFRADGANDSPLLTPSQLDEVDPHSKSTYFTLQRRKPALGEPPEEAQKAYEKFLRRRQAEFLRRTSEVVLLSAVSLCVLLTPGAAQSAWAMHRGMYTLIWESSPNTLTAISTQIAIFISLLILYVFRVLLGPLLQNGEIRFGRIRVPSSFDPATVIYPTALPILVALSLSDSLSGALLPNIVLGLSTLPARLIPSFGAESAFSSFHWMVTVLPLISAENTAWPRRTFPSKPYQLLPLKGARMDSEDIVLLFPLQQILLTILQYLTTTSLLPSELQLLSVSLINILLLSETPQSRILAILLWIGGVCLLILSDSAIRANVTLERIPSWRLKRASTKAQAVAAFALPFRKSRKSMGPLEMESDDEVDMDSAVNGRADTVKRTGHNANNWNQTLEKTRSAPTSSPSIAAPAILRRRSIPTMAQNFLNLSSQDIMRRKWLYSGYTLLIALAIIFLPIRIAVQKFALNDMEPFGWALGYLFSDIAEFRAFVNDRRLQDWIVFPSLGATALQLPFKKVDRVEYIRMAVLGTANSRLFLFAYWASTIAVGVITVLTLSNSVEVDTRRKIFHGTMVIMLLPTTFIDPAFLSLGLALVLAVFLLLDLFRAGQLRPISKPIAQFLTPYVDGRDLRGPVVISHIFLLIGCAIPLWLSLTGVERGGAGPWAGWEVTTRDMSMLSGVICVGMGDAAASLIGRRFGRHKWPWTGGKSLEGSAAFAAAVSCGLILTKTWLRYGKWATTHEDCDSWVKIIAKAVLAACGASFTEAVLTGCNDNVVVPVILWLLVRGTKL